MSSLLQPSTSTSQDAAHPARRRAEVIESLGVSGRLCIVAPLKGDVSKAGVSSAGAFVIGKVQPQLTRECAKQARQPRISYWERRGSFSARGFPGRFGSRRLQTAGHPTGCKERIG